MVVDQGWGMEEVEGKVQLFSYRMNKVWGPNVQHCDYSSLYSWNLLGEYTHTQRMWGDGCVSNLILGIF